MMGADVVVSGSALFKGNNPAENIRIMLNSLKSGRN
jgi:pentose-5-phosphate-3-epimerase